jgi:serine phosphatase RsbU (regulator of sigma subunit)/anti-sigma regulatory factor (Ser/Thr protein kinase)
VRGREPAVPRGRSRWEAIRELLGSGDDPYAGADLTISRNAVAVLSAIHGVLVLLLLPLSPPNEAVGDIAGWAIALAGVGVNFGAALWLLNERRQVSFDSLLLLTYAGAGQLLVMQLLAQAVLPYQLLMLVWVGASGVQPTRRALLLLAVLLAAMLAPIAVGPSTVGDRNLIGRAFLFATIGLVLIAYVAYVRVQRVRLVSQESDARAEATAAAKRVRDLQWITDAALTPVGLQDLLDQLLDRVVRVFAAEEGAILLSADGGSALELRAARGLATGTGRSGERAIRTLAARIARAREAAAFEVDGDHSLGSDGTDAQSVLGVPLMVDRRLLGVLYVGTHVRRRFVEDDVALLQLVGDRVALAVDRARRFERERHIAETLQRSLLPEKLPRIPGTEGAARYLPAGAGTEVGGDWYEMLELPDGRIVLAMGDVVGRGVRAAALMGKLRTSLEAYALDGRQPAEVVERLHSVMERQHPAEMATLLYVSLDLDRQRASLANAGHLAPIVRAADGRSRYVGGEVSPPLGAVPYARFRESHFDIGPDSTLLLFTDGVVEQQGENVEVRLEELRRSVEAAPSAPDALCDFVLRRMLSRPKRQDDVALLALRLSPLPRKGFELDLPAEPEVLSSVRTALERWLDRAPISHEDAYAIKVACGEACANAVEHAYDPGDAAFRMEASRSGDEIVIAVRDFGTWREPRGSDRGRGLALMEALMDSVDVTPSSGGTTVRLTRRLKPS